MGKKLTDEEWAQKIEKNLNTDFWVEDQNKSSQGLHMFYHAIGQSILAGRLDVAGDYDTKEYWMLFCFRLINEYVPAFRTRKAKGKKRTKFTGLDRLTFIGRVQRIRARHDTSVEQAILDLVSSGMEKRPTEHLGKYHSKYLKEEVADIRTRFNLRDWQEDEIKQLLIRSAIQFVTAEDGDDPDYLQQR